MIDENKADSTPAVVKNAHRPVCVSCSGALTDADLGDFRTLCVDCCEKARIADQVAKQERKVTTGDVREARSILLNAAVEEVALLKDMVAERDKRIGDLDKAIKGLTVSRSNLGKGMAHEVNARNLAKAADAKLVERLRGDLSAAGRGNQRLQRDLVEARMQAAEAEHDAQQCSNMVAVANQKIEQLEKSLEKALVELAANKFNGASHVDSHETQWRKDLGERLTHLHEWCAVLGFVRADLVLIEDGESAKLTRGYTVIPSDEQRATTFTPPVPKDPAHSESELESLGEQLRKAMADAEAARDLAKRASPFATQAKIDFAKSDYEDELLRRPGGGDWLTLQKLVQRAIAEIKRLEILADHWHGDVLALRKEQAAWRKKDEAREAGAYLSFRVLLAEMTGRADSLTILAFLKKHAPASIEVDESSGTPMLKAFSCSKDEGLVAALHDAGKKAEGKIRERDFVVTSLQGLVDDLRRQRQESIAKDKEQRLQISNLHHGEARAMAKILELDEAVFKSMYPDAESRTVDGQVVGAKKPIKIKFKSGICKLCGLACAMGWERCCSSCTTAQNVARFNLHTRPLPIPKNSGVVCKSILCSGSQKPGSRGFVAETMEKVFEECRALRNAGQKEYAHDEDRAFANFERLAADLGISRELILLVYFKKHYDGVVAWVKGHKSQRESVVGRINDQIVYLILLRAMHDETQLAAKSGPAS